jgi:uncharacterized protein (TIGR00255 family)
LVAISMTGFGVAERTVGRRRARVEIRTVNHRFFNLAARLPSEWQAHEAAVRELMREAFDRGHVAVSVQWIDEGAVGGPGLNLERAVAAQAAIAELRDRLGLAGEVTLDQVLRFPEVIGARRAEAEPAVEWEAVRPAIEAAVAACQVTRTGEGAVLAAEIVSRLAAIADHADEVERLLPERLERELSRLRQAVASLAGEAALPADRLAAEVALFADRVDVTEELVRLRAHVAAARDTVTAGGSMGKRLGFLAQELGREVNTIGSKANDAAIAQHVVAMKSELEKVREQVENLA